MLFNSYIFIFLFLPVTLAGYWTANRMKCYGAGKTWLILMSLWFYGYFNPSYLFIITGSILVNFLIYRVMSKTGDSRRKFLLAAGILCNVFLLFYFKYYDFFIENINVLFRSTFTLKHIVLPLGISFFTFQQISFLVDVYRKDVDKYGFLDYALFVTFFPQLIAGPIVTHAEMIPQFRRSSQKKVDWELFARGLFIFIAGLFKKVIVADTFGRAVDWGYSNIGLMDSTNGILLMLFFTIQLYFDFSGYCDMARGIGFFFGVNIPLNFDSPYKAVNNLDFWKRWHMTLNRFLTQYIYIPLGGSRKGAARTYLNLFLVFLISGIWHGAAWTYVVWGILHGVMCMLTKAGIKWIVRLPKLLTWFVTFLFFNLSVIVFRSDSLRQAWDLIGRIFSMRFEKVSEELCGFFNLTEFWYHMKVLKLTELPYAYAYCMILFLMASLAALFAGKNLHKMSEEFRPRVSTGILLGGMLVWSVLSLTGVSSFLYYNF